MNNRTSRRSLSNNFLHKYSKITSFLVNCLHTTYRLLTDYQSVFESSLSANMFLYLLRSFSEGLCRFGHAGVGFDVFSGCVLHITLLRNITTRTLVPRYSVLQGVLFIVKLILLAALEGEI